MRNFAFQRTDSVATAIAAHAEPGEPAYLAGGTTLIDLVKLDVMRPSKMVDINRLPLSQIERLPDGGLKIGALVRNSDLAWHAAVKQDYPLLAQAILSGASPQLRNMATTAGNLMQRTRCTYFRDNVSPCNKREPGSGCAAQEGYNRMHAIFGGSPACIATHASDMCVALAALEAEVVVSGSRGERTILFSDFHLLPGLTPEREHALRDDELITAVVLPPPLPGARGHYLKLRDRESFEFALVSVAVLLHREGSRIREARIALGGVGTKPWRVPSAERLLQGKEPSPAVFQSAAEGAFTEAEPRQHNAFKIPLARLAIQRALAEVTSENASRV